MSQPSSSRYLILTAVDASALADTVVDRAVAQARQTPGAQLHIAHAIEMIPVAAATLGGSSLSVPSAALLMKAGREHLERLLSRAEQGGFTATGHLLIGSPINTVLQLTASLSADLLIVGTGDPGKIMRILLGSVAETMVRKAPCPVFVVRAKRESAAHPEVPEILPPCPDCLATQQATNGQQLWCARHSEHHPRAHTYYEYPEGFGSGSMTYHAE
jgi:nucleotide-binding universal stress UspA family protein